MAAINIHVGTQEPEDRVGSSCALPGMLGDPRKCVPPLSATHNGLTRMLWIRRALEDLVSKMTVRVQDGTSLGKGGGKGAELYFVFDPPFTKNSLPWMPAAVETFSYTGLIGEARKMRCPTWDLPSGAIQLGGACPGATAGQSTVPQRVRDAYAPGVGQPVMLEKAICQICYAGGGQYASPHVQIGEILRYWWTRNLLHHHRAFHLWIDTMVRAFEGKSWLAERSISPRTGQPIFPVRIHSSGDFFSPEYARAWIEVANQLPQLDFWAPTRTWASPTWIGFWEKNLPLARHGNLIVRPSSWHTGDPAIFPEGRVLPVGILHPRGRPEKPWSGPYPFLAGGRVIAGTTAIYRTDSPEDDRIVGQKVGHSDDPRCDWICAAYAKDSDKHTCLNAEAPDTATTPGAPMGCRICWTAPETRVCYTAH